MTRENVEPRPLCRPRLFVPAAEPRKLEPAAEAGADALVLDLEGSVAPRLKRAACRLVADAPRTLERTRGSVL